MNIKIIMTVAIMLIAIKGQTAPTLESLYGDFFNETGVYIQVFSGGCTNKNSFAIQKEYFRGVEQIYFYRFKPDLCKAYFKYGKFVNFSYEDLGLNRSDRFKIMNPRVTPRVLR
ncbi:MAG: hypothetical protein V4654_00680 [Bdellovibrionota bacterium]